jgi:hypothetical protein
MDLICEKKETSRRSFAKLIIAAIAAMPIASSLVDAQGRRNRRWKRHQGPGTLTHDTPPPITLSDGSLEVETLEQLTTTSTVAPFRYSAFSGTANIAHIKVLDGKGTEIHYEPKARGSSIKFVLEKDDGTKVDEVIVTGGSVLEITSNRKLGEHPSVNPNGFRKHKCVHPGHTSGGRFRVRSIEILNAPRKFKFVARSLTSHPTYFSEEYKVMLWLDR